MHTHRKPVSAWHIALWLLLAGTLLAAPVRAQTTPMVAAGGNHSCAARSSGEVQCWGSNESGQLGNGSTTDHSTPVAVSGITSAASVSSGRIHTCAVLNDGRVQCWGGLPGFFDRLPSDIGTTRKDFGALGDGSTGGSASPVSVSGMDNAVAVSAGEAHTCAVLRGGAGARCNVGGRTISASWATAARPTAPRR